MARPSNIIRWTKDEYLLLAQGLVGRYPKRRYDEVQQLADLDFERGDLDFVQHRALPKKRQRVVQSLDTARRHIFDALVELRNGAPAKPAPPPAADPPPAATKAGPVTWNPKELRLFALSLHTMNPDCHFLNSTDMEGLTISMLNRAALVMEPARQRTFHALDVMRPRMLEVYAAVRAERDPLFYPKFELQQPPPVHLTARQERLLRRAPGPVLDVLPSFVVNAHRPPPPAQREMARQLAEELAALEETVPVIEPAAVPAPDLPPLAAAPAALPAPDTGDDADEASYSGRPPVKWTREEWLVVAEALHARFPLCHYPDSPDLHGMTSSEVARAQFALPFERRRPHLKVTSFKTFLRPPLLSAFRDLKNRLITAAQPAAAAPAPDQPPAPATPAPAKLAAVAPSPRDPEPVTAPPPVVAPASSALNPYEAAFKPLLDLFAKQGAAQLQPLHAQVAALAQQIAALQASVTRLAAAPAAPPSPFGSIFHPDKARPPLAEAAAVARPAVAKPATPPRSNPPHIGILGNRSSFHTDLLEREFPGIVFTCIDTGKRIDSIKNCDKVVGMVGWASHASIQKLKRAAGERFVRIDGSLTDLKRNIAVWIASGALTPLVTPAAPPLMGTA